MSVHSRINWEPRPDRVRYGAPHNPPFDSPPARANADRKGSPHVLEREEPREDVFPLALADVHGLFHCPPNDPNRENVSKRAIFPVVYVSERETVRGPPCEVDVTLSGAGR